MNQHLKRLACQLIMQTTKKIGTHSGVFHADDAMGCMLLRNFTKKYESADIVRSRDPEVLKDLDIVIDVGGEYDPVAQRYDHHQKGFNEHFGHNFDIKLSASGLVYKHYGKEIIRNGISHLIQNNAIPSTVEPKVSDEYVDEIYCACYKSLFVTLDALDNGIERYPKDVKPRYDYYKTDLASRVGRLNPNWWDDSTAATYDENFKKAMEICKDEFLECLKTQVMGTIVSAMIVEEAFENNSKLDNQLIILPRSCFWKEAIYRLEEKHGRKGVTKYVVYPAADGEGYRIQCVSINANSFENRLSLKEEWRGLDRQTLQEKSGISDAVFCHHSGFIGGAKSIESVLKMAEESIQSAK